MRDRAPIANGGSQLLPGGLTMDAREMGSGDEVTRRVGEHFASMVQSVGVKRFAASLGLSTRQVNRMLAGAQPNPVERLLRSLQASMPDVGDRALDVICQEMGGFFVREEGTLDKKAINAVRECAEAIAAISDGNITSVDEVQIREAIAALIALSRAVQDRSAAGGEEDGGVRVNVNPHPPISLGTRTVPSRPETPPR